MAAETSKHLTALIAEDEPAMLSLVSRHVRSLGLDVVEASDGDLAWELAQAHRPDLVMLDVMMPGMSGWEVCKRVKAHAAEGQFGATGVIMLTGIGENLNDMTSQLFGADTWLNKPFDFNELDNRIGEVLAKHGKARPSGNPVREGVVLPSEAPAKHKAAPKKAAPKKAPPKKVPPKKVAPKKAPPKKVAPKKAPPKKVPPKKAPPKKVAPKKAPPKKAPPKKAPPKKAPPKKAPPKKAPPKKPAAKRAR